MTPVLQDMFGKDFTEGDRVVYAAANGVRVGKVEWIKEMPSVTVGIPIYKVYINLAEHRAVASGPAKMYAQKMGYIYRTDSYHSTAHHFLKV